MELQNSPKVKAAGVRVIGVSADAPADSRKLAARLKLSSVKLYSDTHAKGAASKAVKYWDAKVGISKLGVMVVKNGRVAKRFYGKQSIATLLKAAK